MNPRIHAFFALLVAVFLFGCPQQWPGFVTCEDLDACTTTETGSTGDGGTPSGLWRVRAGGAPELVALFDLTGAYGPEPGRSWSSCRAARSSARSTRGASTFGARRLAASTKRGAHWAWAITRGAAVPGAAVRGTSTLVGTGATGIGDLLNEGTFGGEGAAVGKGASGVASKSGGVERGGEGVGAFASVNVTVTPGALVLAGGSKPTNEGGFHSIGEVTTDDCAGSACGGAGRAGSGAAGSGSTPLPGRIQRSLLRPPRGLSRRGGASGLLKLEPGAARRCRSVCAGPVGGSGKRAVG